MGQRHATPRQAAWRVCEASKTATHVSFGGVQAPISALRRLTLERRLWGPSQWG
jgi:hypothetical protein